MQQYHYAMPYGGAPHAPYASYGSQFCEVCGRKLESSGAGATAQWTEAAWMAQMEGLNRIYGGALEPYLRTLRPQQTPGMSHAKDCGCGHCCAPDKCHCRCCISDADLVVYSRVGERRVVPLIVENHYRRERTIHLDLSKWTTRGGLPVNVTAQLEATDFKLAACEERSVALTVEVGFTPESPNDPDREEPRQRPDVDECKVYYADLRVEGCDIRPVRIALALLPRDCAAHKIHCRCTCC